jgi:hypothetical protein
LNHTHIHQQRIRNVRLRPPATGLSGPVQSRCNPNNPIRAQAHVCFHSPNATRPELSLQARKVTKQLDSQLCGIPLAAGAAAVMGSHIQRVKPVEPCSWVSAAEEHLDCWLCFIDHADLGSATAVTQASSPGPGAAAAVSQGACMEAAEDLQRGLRAT